MENQNEKQLYLQILDPSGHRRIIKLTRFPHRLGTSIDTNDGLRDVKIQEAGLLICEGQSGYILRVIQEGLTLRVGDLKLLNFEIPMQTPIQAGDSELRFSVEHPKVIEQKQGLGDWLTVSESGSLLLNGLRKAAQTRLSIYLSGETGTGKEVLAKMIHELSDRCTGTFVPINCGALALSLAESELFGHIKGAFTGAMRDRPGALLQAQGGTLFLDEVGDLPPEIQVKLLRFLENGEIRPVGSDRVLHADVRVICATHKPLVRLVQEGKFRQDLYYRLASIPLEIPTLRARPDDIELLARRFASDQKKALTADAIRKLQLHAWPGNVRELRHAVERAAGSVGAFESVIHARDFDFLIQRFEGDEGDLLLPGVKTLHEMEKLMILRALKLGKGNRSEAARILGVARSTLFEMMKRHRIVGPKSAKYWVMPKDAVLTPAGATAEVSD
ncbi:MAG: sigma-54-dependent Fis family transcriptional regulator [Bdellovibrionales bacterium]|nr:sigma-54-dependent Fis family transcriptional regulator [Bdellovibrionales bacterium]